MKTKILKFFRGDKHFMNDAVREADKIVGEYLKRLGYVKPARKVPSKKGGRIVFCAAVSLVVCVFLSYIILKITI